MILYFRNFWKITFLIIVWYTLFVLCIFVHKLLSSPISVYTKIYYSDPSLWAAISQGVLINYAVSKVAAATLHRNSFRNFLVQFGGGGREGIFSNGMSDENWNLSSNSWPILARLLWNEEKINESERTISQEGRKRGRVKGEVCDYTRRGNNVNYE